MAKFTGIDTTRVHVYPSPQAVPWQVFWDVHGIRAVWSDIENTHELIVSGRPKTFCEKTLSHFEMLHHIGYFVGCGTNSLGDFSQAAAQAQERLRLPSFQIVQPPSGPFNGIFGWKGTPHKPQPEYYQQLARLSGYRADQCLFIGDKLLFDVLPAVQTGMIGIWVPPMGPDLRMERWVRRRQTEERYRRRLGLTKVCRPSE